MSDMEGKPREPMRRTGDLYSHVEYLGRIGESPAEKSLREGLNDHGRALEQLQRGNNVEDTARKENPSNKDNNYRQDDPYKALED